MKQKKYSVVIFKNKKKFKLVNKYATLEGAKNSFNRLMEKSNKVLFHKEVVNRTKSYFELSILQTSSKKKNPYYIKDEYGRQIKVEFDDSSYHVIKMEKFYEEEKFLDKINNKKITIYDFINNYLKPKKGLKMISKLNNKVILQVDNSVDLFVFKDYNDSDRFIDVLFNYLKSKKIKDCMLVKDYSTAQRIDLYNILEKLGISRKFLYRHNTSVYTAQR